MNQDIISLRGGITQVGVVEGGVSRTGRSWRKQTCVMETLQEPKRRIAFEVRDRDIDSMAFAQGQVRKIYVDIESRPYAGRWYTNLRAWGMEYLDAQGRELSQAGDM